MYFLQHHLFEYVAQEWEGEVVAHKGMSNHFYEYCLVYVMPASMETRVSVNLLCVVTSILMFFWVRSDLSLSSVQ